MSRYFSSILLIIFVSTCLFYYFNVQTYSLRVGNSDISLIIADSPRERQRGLGGRYSLPENTAMLFIFDQLDKHSFWMKGMLFPIDIIWLNEEYEIVHIESNVSPDTFPQMFSSSQKSMYVLETNAYFSEKNKIKVGDKLNIILPE